MQLHIRIEGTPEELRTVLRALPGAATLGTAAVELGNEAAPRKGGVQESNGHDSMEVSVAFARRVLTRLGLGRRMRAVLAELREAHPDWVPLTKLHGIADYKPAQFAGLLGSFGRRVANTEGYDPGLTFIQHRWNNDEGNYEYRIPGTVCEALEAEQLV